MLPDLQSVNVLAAKTDRNMPLELDQWRVYRSLADERSSLGRLNLPLSSQQNM